MTDGQTAYDGLLQCRTRPHVLDDATLARVTQVYGEQRDFLPVHREQVSRWQALALSPAQRDEVAHLSARLDRFDALLGDILALAQELSPGTIDRLMGMSDEDLAAAVLSGALKLPRR
ncbi:hypothetical protein CF70_006230 [Cupriavidus sp. SK-3]|uniref:hypothetical protein n=1 Tax=Cupriavidus sp. SK-3 TaxID=1470558 RepID=UPI00044EC5BF|nr:hypothetical protein [Cupriavidus sp. SK-3]KDP86638.1 hypothetical protein CF70_006230 [Cupriavidus sp. SK-3]